VTERGESDVFLVALQLLDVRPSVIEELEDGLCVVVSVEGVCGECPGVGVFLQQSGEFLVGDGLDAFGTALSYVNW